MANKHLKDCPRWELRQGEDLFPACLCDLEEVPPVIYGIGDVNVLETASMAVVGARRATPYGIDLSRMAGRVAAESGITLVSGGAMGCDAAAQRGALDTGGKVVVVSGVGADQVYPASSLDVFERAVALGGCVIAEVPWGSHAMPYAFPRRNRIIAALSRAVLVAEAGQHSGTTSTALAAFDLGREVYAVPGSVFSPQSRGANRLIADGAHIICSEEDLELLISRDFGVLRLVAEQPATPRGRVMSALVASPMRADDLADHLGMSALELLKVLADYEVQGVVTRLPDGRYSPTSEAYLGAC
jgi:DNA processing protein